MHWLWNLLFNNIQSCWILLYDTCECQNWWITLSMFNYSMNHPFSYISVYYHFQRTIFITKSNQTKLWSDVMTASFSEESFRIQALSEQIFTPLFNFLYIYFFLKPKSITHIQRIVHLKNVNAVISCFSIQTQKTLVHLRKSNDPKPWQFIILIT